MTGGDIHCCKGEDYKTMDELVKTYLCGKIWEKYIEILVLIIFEWFIHVRI